MNTLRFFLAAAVGGTVLTGLVLAQPPAKAPSEAVAPATPKKHPLRVTVSIAPLKGLVERLVPEGTKVEVLIPPGASEHGFELSPARLATLQQSDVVVIVGMGLEPQIEKFLKANPRANRREIELAVAAGVEKEENEHDHTDPAKPGDGHDHKDHKDGAPNDHKHDHDHDHGAADPHIWLDPTLMTLAMPRLAKAIAASCDKAAAESVMERSNRLGDDLARLDETYKAVLSGVKHRQIVVAHDAYGWLAKRYNFETIAIAGLMAGEPTPGAIAKAIELVKENSLPVIFIEPQLSAAAAKKIAEATGAKTMILDPLGNGDYFKMMRSNLLALFEAMGGDPKRLDELKKQNEPTPDKFEAPALPK